MAVTDLTLTLIRELSRDLRRQLTIRQLARASGKPYANVYHSVQQLITTRVINREIIGHSHACALNLESDLCCLYIALAHGPEDTNGHLSDHPAHMVWMTDSGLLLIADTIPQSTEGTWMTVSQFTRNKELFATIGQHRLLSGHTFYADLLRRHR